MAILSDIKQEALKSLEGRWGDAIKIYFVYLLILVGIQGVLYIGTIASIVIAGPLLLGLTISFLKFSRTGDLNFNQLFDGLKSFENSFIAYVLVKVYTFLWGLLFIIPGIIKGISYSQTFYILADNPEVKAGKAIEMSVELMDGYKMKYFILCLSFIGWILLSLLTFGIGFLWLGPYVQVTFAKFHDDINVNAGAIENATIIE